MPTAEARAGESDRKREERAVHREFWRRLSRRPPEGADGERATAESPDRADGELVPKQRDRRGEHRDPDRHRDRVDGAAERDEDPRGREKARRRVPTGADQVEARRLARGLRWQDAPGQREPGRAGWNFDEEDPAPVDRREESADRAARPSRRPAPPPLRTRSLLPRSPPHQSGRIAAAALRADGLGLLREVDPEQAGRASRVRIVTRRDRGRAPSGRSSADSSRAIDWRWIFLVNVPICAAGLALSWRVLPPKARATARFVPDRAGRPRRRPSSRPRGSSSRSAAPSTRTVGGGRGAPRGGRRCFVRVRVSPIRRFRRRSSHPRFAAAWRDSRLPKPRDCTARSSRFRSLSPARLSIPVAFALAAFSRRVDHSSRASAGRRRRCGTRTPPSDVRRRRWLPASAHPTARSPRAQLPWKLLAATLAFAGRRARAHVPRRCGSPRSKSCRSATRPSRRACLDEPLLRWNARARSPSRSHSVARSRRIRLRALFWLFTAAAFAAAIPSLALCRPGVPHDEPIAEEVAAKPRGAARRPAEPSTSSGSPSTSRRQPRWTCDHRGDAELRARRPRHARATRRLL